MGQLIPYNIKPAPHPLKHRGELTHIDTAPWMFNPNTPWWQWPQASARIGTPLMQMLVYGRQLYEPPDPDAYPKSWDWSRDIASPKFRNQPMPQATARKPATQLMTFVAMLEATKVPFGVEQLEDTITEIKVLNKLNKKYADNIVGLRNNGNYQFFSTWHFDKDGNLLSVGHWK